MASAASSPISPRTHALAIFWKSSYVSKLATRAGTEKFVYPIEVRAALGLPDKKSNSALLSREGMVPHMARLQEAP